MPEEPAAQDELIKQVQGLKAENQSLTQLVVGLEKDITERFDEVAILTRSLLKSESDFKEFKQRNTILHNRSKAFARELAKSRFNDYRNAIKNSEYFDEIWYLNQYDDVGKSGMDPLEHFILQGAQEYRNPSPLFDTYWYVSKYVDVQQSTANPLVHFINNGVKEGRLPLPPTSPSQSDDTAKETV